MKNAFPSHLSDSALVATLIRLTRGEREATVLLMPHLAEFDRRKLFRQAGCSSLFVYCTRVLRFSEQEAYNRMIAARAVRRYPQILDLLADGSLNLTTLKLIGRHLTPENHQTVIEGACGRSKRQVLELLARLFPQPDVPGTVRALPAVAPTSPEPATPTFAPPVRSQPVPGAPVVTLAPTIAQAASTPAPSPLARHRPAVTPLAPERYQITFTASADTREKLEFAKDLLSHSMPTGDVAAIMDRALTALIEQLVRRKFAVTARPRNGCAKAKDPCYVPAAVKRAVYIRDRGRCAFAGKNGARCNERAFVQFHHSDPKAVGGAGTVQNIRLMCRTHNQYEADVFFGLRPPDGVVSEARSGYWMATLRSTRSGTSCVAEVQPDARRARSASVLMAATGGSPDRFDANGSPGR